MDDGISMSIPLWAQEFFDGFPWSRARILSMLLSLPPASDVEAPQHQLRCPFFLYSDRFAADDCEDVDPAPVSQEGQISFEDFGSSLVIKSSSLETSRKVITQ